MDTACIPEEVACDINKIYSFGPDICVVGRERKRTYGRGTLFLKKDRYAVIQLEYPPSARDVGYQQAVLNDFY